MRQSFYRLIFIAAAVSLTACTSFFDKDNSPEPAPLPTYSPEAMPVALWSTRTGSGADGDYLKMAPSSSGNAIYTASHNGVISSVNPSTGYVNWRINSSLSPTSGTGSGDGIVVVGGQHGHIQAFAENSGQPRWQTDVPGEILSQPAVQNGVVVIKTINGYVYAFASSDGHKLWSRLFTEPTLILRGSSAPRLSGNRAFIGLASGRLLSLNAHDGQLLWDVPVSIPEGAFSIQRMIDIDANPVVHGQHIYAATYQGHIAALDWGTGNTSWSRDISSYTGMCLSDDTIYLSDAKSHVWAFNAATGDTRWELSSLANRHISGPVVMGQYVVVGDSQGFLHWVNKNTGRYAARAYVDNSGILASPIVENSVLYALSNKGNLVAYKLN